MHLYRRFGAAKRRPWKQRQTEIYCGGVQCINGVLQVEPEVFFGVELAGLYDQPMRELGINSPVSSFVGICQSRAPDRRTNAHVVQLGRLRGETRFDIAQAFPLGQLRKHHRERDNVRVYQEDTLSDSRSSRGHPKLAVTCY